SPRHAGRDGRDPLLRQWHLRQRRAHAPARAELGAVRSVVRRSRAARLSARGPGPGPHRGAPLQLPLRPGLPRAPGPARSPGRLSPGGRLRRTAAARRGLQRVASRPGNAPAPSRVFLAHAPDAPHASGGVPAVPARPDLLGRRAAGRGVSRPPQPPGPGRLRSSAGRRPPSGQAPWARRAVRDRRRSAAGRIATATDPTPSEPDSPTNGSAPSALTPAAASEHDGAMAIASVVPSAPRATAPVMGTARRRLGQAMTIVSALVLVAVVGFVMYSHTGEPRMALIEQPERALALIVGRTMDVEAALRGAKPWERRLYALTLTDGGSEIRQAITWYEELASYSVSPNVDLHLGVLVGEAGLE